MAPNFMLACMAVALAVVSVVFWMACASMFTSMPALFFGHIAAMLGCWCMMLIGSLTYAFTGFWPASGKLREKARMAHGIVQSLACLMGLIGYVCIFRNHQLVGGSQFGFDAGNPLAKTIHALLGYVVLGWMLLQVVQGWAKFLGIPQMAHALSGRTMLMFAAANMALVMTALPMNGPVIAAIMIGGILAVTGIAAFVVSPQGKSLVAAKELSGPEENNMMYEPLHSAGC